MVKYRRARAQKPSNVCFTGRESEQCSLVIRTQRMDNCAAPPPFKQPDDLLDSSDGHKVLNVAD